MENIEIQNYVKLGFTPQFPYEIIDPKNDVELSIGVKDGILYIAFLGSTTFKDWLHDFMFWKKPYKNMKNLFFIHAGFLKIYKIVRERIHTFLLTKKDEYDTIIISGHSLGAAVATVCYEDVMFMKEEGVIKNVLVKCITSGTPRVFGVFGSKILNKRIGDKIEVVYGNDIVPTVPPAIMLYKHFGKKFHFGKRSIFGALAPSSIYHHCWTKYISLENSEKDTKDNNPYYKKSKLAYGLFYALSIITLLVIML